MSKTIVYLAGIICGLSCSVTSAAEWAYKETKGPEKWADLAPEYSICGSGKNQSPINIDTKKAINIEAAGIKFNYGLTLPETITNTGNLIQVNTRGWAKLNVDDIEFKLQHLEFHIPSEHTIDGKHFPMEIQFIHESEGGQTAIVSRMAIPGRPDRALRKLFEKLPMQAGETEKLSGNALRNIEMKMKVSNYFYYNGSMTTPPCSEGVRWYLMKAPMTFSKEQYNQLKSAVEQDNNRPVQTLNARMILE